MMGDPNPDGHEDTPSTSSQQPPQPTPVSDVVSNQAALGSDLVAANQPGARSGTGRDFPGDAPPVHEEPMLQESSQGPALVHRLLPDLLGEETTSTLREEVNAKLQKINTLIGNAAEIQKKYQAVADQNSQKSILEMLEKLHSQKWSLEEELSQLSRLEQRNTGYDTLTSYASRLTESRSSTEPATAPLPPPPKSDKPKNETNFEDLSNSVGILRGNLKEVIARKGELEGMVEVLRQKLDQCETVEEQKNLKNLLERHMDRISQLNHTVQEAQQTVLVMEHLDRQRNGQASFGDRSERVASPERGNSDDEDTPVDADTMNRLRERLKKMRSQVQVMEEREASGSHPQTATSSVDPRAFMNSGDTGGPSKTSGPPNKADPRYPSCPESGALDWSSRPQPPPLSVKMTSFMETQRYPIRDQTQWPYPGQGWNNASMVLPRSSGQWNETVDAAPPLRTQLNRNAEHHGFSANAAQCPVNQRERFDSNQSSDTDVEDSRRDTGSGSRHDSRTNNFAQFAKRNDLGLPQTPKKDSNSRNWKNGAESGRGRGMQPSGENCQHEYSGSEREQPHHLLEDPVHDSGECHLEAAGREMPVADMVRSLQKIMAEQQKILNTCAQYVSKPAAGERIGGSCTPDQLRSGELVHREIPMINNTLRSEEAGCSAGGHLRPPATGERQGLLNNQRNDARSISMSPNLVDGVPVEARRRNRIPAQPLDYAAGVTHPHAQPSAFDSMARGCDAQEGYLSNNMSHGHGGDFGNAVGVGQTDFYDYWMSDWWRAIYAEYRGDLPLLESMLRSISRVKTHTARRNVATALADAVDAEFGQPARTAGLHFWGERPETQCRTTAPDAFGSSHCTYGHSAHGFFPGSSSSRHGSLAVPDLVGNGRVPNMFGSGVRPGTEPSNNPGHFPTRHISSRDLDSARSHRPAATRNLVVPHYQTDLSSNRVSTAHGPTPGQLEQLCRGILSTPTAETAELSTGNRLIEGARGMHEFARREQDRYLLADDLAHHMIYHSPTPTRHRAPGVAFPLSTVELNTTTEPNGTAPTGRGVADREQVGNGNRSDSNGSTADYDMTNEYPAGSDNNFPGMGQRK